MSYTGGCHCGAIRFELNAPIERVLDCNCSICSKRGHVLAFAPASAFDLKQGQEALADYQFGKKTIHHMFCRHCGVGAFGGGRMPDGTETVAVNVRCLDDFDYSALPIDHYDGKNL